MKRKLKITLALYLIFFTAVIIAQRQETNSIKLSIQPEPKEIVPLNKYFDFRDEKFISLNPASSIEHKAAGYFKHLLFEKFENELTVNIINNKSNSFVRILFEKINQDSISHNNQYYEIKCNADKKEILLKYKSQLGLLFACVTLSEYFQKAENGIKLSYFDIKDYPDFSRRIISAIPKPDEVFELLDFALKNKIETIAIGSRQYPWYKASDEFKKLFAEISLWKNKYGGPSIMQMHNIYEEKHIEISNDDDVNALKEVIKIGIDNGADKLMILADDTPPFKFGEGYILTTENDKKKFKHMADAHCYLMNDIKIWLNEKSLQSELYYVPPFYTYEDMHYGDMELYKNTRWEDDAYKPIYRDLNYLGVNIPEDVFIIWCGPFVRSRTITAEDINDWTYNLKGITPFLWDNTIYSHNPFISSPLFTAWDNNFPADFKLRTAGNGMFINGAANMEDSKATAITVNDYMWNSSTYSAVKSLNQALNKLYGNSSNLLLQLREVELELRKKIGERELWFESDSLWKIIRKIRFIHSKNPFDYHLNYTRLKGLRLQLKNSVPEPIDKIEFINQCNELYKRRNDIMSNLQIEIPEAAERLKKLLLELPDFEKIQ